jgi:hypothetical protein
LYHYISHLLVFQVCFCPYASLIRLIALPGQFLPPPPLNYKGLARVYCRITFKSADFTILGKRVLHSYNTPLVGRSYIWLHFVIQSFRVKLDLNLPLCL